MDNDSYDGWVGTNIEKVEDIGRNQQRLKFLDNFNKNDLRWFERIAVCGFGTFIIVIMLSPALVYSILLSGQYIISITPQNCDMSVYAAGFPPVISDFYSQTEGLTSIVGQTDWYLGEWRIYANSFGICPMEAFTTVDSYKNVFHSEAPKDGDVAFLNPNHCLPLGIRDGDVPANVITVMSNIDDANRTSNPRGPTNMVAAVQGIRRTGVYILAGTIVTWLGIFLNFLLFPTITYHAGTLIFLNILLWWLPSLGCLNEILFGDFNGNHNWNPLFPGCAVSWNASLSPGVVMLYWQGITLGIWLFGITVFAVYTLFIKKWSSDDEDEISKDSLFIGDSLYVYREHKLDMKTIETEFFKCPADHMCLRSFGYPPALGSREAPTPGNVQCSICQMEGIDVQRFWAYFVYCPQCLDNESAVFTVCMKCISRWHDGIDLKRRGIAVHHHDIDTDMFDELHVKASRGNSFDSAGSAGSGSIATSSDFSSEGGEAPPDHASTPNAVQDFLQHVSTKSGQFVRALSSVLRQPVSEAAPSTARAESPDSTSSATPHTRRLEMTSLKSV